MCICQETSNGVSYPHFRWSSGVCWQNVATLQRRCINSWVRGSVSVYWLDYTNIPPVFSDDVCVRIVRYYTSILQNPILNKNMCGIALYCSEVVAELKAEGWCCSCCPCGLWPFDLKPQTLCRHLSVMCVLSHHARCDNSSCLFQKRFSLFSRRTCMYLAL